MSACIHGEALHYATRVYWVYLKHLECILHYPVSTDIHVRRCVYLLYRHIWDESKSFAQNRCRPVHMKSLRILGLKTCILLESMLFTLSCAPRIYWCASSKSSFPIASWTLSRHALSLGLPSNTSTPAPTGCIETSTRRGFRFSPHRDQNRFVHRPRSQQLFQLRRSSENTGDVCD